MRGGLPFSCEEKKKKSILQRKWKHCDSSRVLRHEFLEKPVLALGKQSVSARH